MSHEFNFGYFGAIWRYLKIFRRNYQSGSWIEGPGCQDYGLYWRYELVSHIDGTWAILQLNVCVFSICEWMRRGWSGPHDSLAGLDSFSYISKLVINDVGK